jgi:hypothetical protein
MHTHVEQIGSTRVLRSADTGPLLDGNALRDLVGDALGHQAEWIAVPVQRLSADFFELRSGMAGQWLQMLVNYRLHFAVLGDVSGYRAQSESLDAWITECNRGRDGCFVADWDALLARLRPPPAPAERRPHAHPRRTWFRLHSDAARHSITRGLPRRRSMRASDADSLHSKVAAVTLGFWVMKIAATTLGETAGDLLSMTLNLGYVASSAILLAIFAGLLGMQLSARRFHPVLFWSVVLATSTAGTTLSDLIDRTLGLGYATGASLLAGCLALVLLAWRVSEKSISVSNIASRRAEGFYWTAVLFSNTLGTALGDFLADDSGTGLHRRRTADRQPHRAHRTGQPHQGHQPGHPVLDRLRAHPPVRRHLRRSAHQAAGKGRPGLRHGGLVAGAVHHPRHAGGAADAAAKAQPAS